MSGSEQQPEEGTEAKSESSVVRRLAPLGILAAVAATVYAFDLHTYLSLDSLREHRQTLTDFVADRGVLAALTFIAIYAISTALSLPGGTILSIAGGFMFGGLLGGLNVVIGATVGATLVFLAARTVLGDTLRKRAGPWFERMEAGFKENAFSYLLTLRLVPIFPFFVVNLVPAFLGVPLRTYVIATAIGILPGVAVFTFTGAGLGSLLDSGEDFSVSSVLTPEIIGALTGLGLLSLLPVMYRWWQGKKAATDPSAT